MNFNSKGGFMKTRLAFAILTLLLTGLAGTAEAGMMNVSCTDSIKSLNKTATMDFSVVCPVNCTQGSVWGTDLYTTDSAICVAAVHANIIKEAGGPVRVKLLPGQHTYTGTFRNGVTTQNWGHYDQSFKVSK